METFLPVLNEFLNERFVYLATSILMIIGLGGVFMCSQLLKKVVGLGIFQSAVILFFINSAYQNPGTIPVLDLTDKTIVAGDYINPLPHTLMLTAIVVGVATLGVALALIIILHREYRTLREDRLLEELE